MAMIADVEELLAKYKPLVLNIAQRYNKNGVGLDDLIQEGYIGVLKAFKNYNGHKSSFGTYSRLYILGYIWRYYKKNSHIINYPLNFPDNQKMQRDSLLLS